MLNDSLRMRLETIAGGAGSTTPLMPTTLSPQTRPTESAGRLAAFEPRLLERGEEMATLSGKHLQIEVPLAEFWRRWAEHFDRGQKSFEALAEQQDAHPELAGFARAFPSRIFFLDLETCGFAGSAIFLIGILRCKPHGPVVQQLLARDYSEERSILEHLWHIAVRHEVLSTFNGKSFDWPMVQDRSTRYLLRRGATGTEERFPLHFDLLHHARRRWRKQLPNCRLQTLERCLLGRRRTDDIPGHAIADAYHRFVRNGCPRQLEQILKHNFLDLVTLLQLSLRLVQ